jgi:hypothetical protein
MGRDRGQYQKQHNCISHGLSITKRSGAITSSASKLTARHLQLTVSGLRTYNQFLR